MSGIYEELMPAIYAYAKANVAFNASVGGNIFSEEAKTLDGKEFITFPYAVFFMLHDSPKYTFTDEGSGILIQWSIFDTSKDSKQIKQIATALHDAFDLAEFTMPSWCLVDMTREGHTPLPKDEHNVKHSVSTYRVIVEKI